MAESINVQKQCLELHTQLQSLSVQFSSDAVHVPSSFPPVYIRMTRGSRSAESSKVHLIPSTSTPGMYTATWTEAILSMTLTVSRDVESGIFVSRDVKYQLKIYSEGKTSHKTLASCTFDVTSLNLESASYSSTEMQQLHFLVGKNAATAISDVVLEASFLYEILPNLPERSSIVASPCSLSSSCSSPSPPPSQLSTSPLPPSFTSTTAVMPPPPPQHLPPTLPHFKQFPQETHHSGPLPSQLSTSPLQPSSTSKRSSTAVALKLPPPPPQHLPPTPPKLKQFPQESHHSGGSKARFKQTETPPSAEKLQPSTTNTSKDDSALKEMVLKGGPSEAVDGGPEIKGPPLPSPNRIVKGKPPKPPRSAGGSKAHFKQTATPPSAEQLYTTNTPAIDTTDNALKGVVLKRKPSETMDGGPEVTGLPSPSTNLIVKGKPPKPPRSAGGSKAHSKQTETPPSAEQLQPSTTSTPAIDTTDNVLKRGPSEAMDGGPEVTSPPLPSPNAIVKGKPPKPPEKSKTKKFKSIFKIKGRKGKSKNKKTEEPTDLRKAETSVSETSSPLQLPMLSIPQPPPTDELLGEGTRIVESSDMVARSCTPSPELKPPRTNGGDAPSKPVRRRTKEKQTEENSMQGLDSTSQRMSGYHHTNTNTPSPIASMDTATNPPKSPTGGLEATGAAFEGQTAVERASTGDGGTHKQTISQIKAWPQEESKPRRFSAPSAPKDDTGRHRHRNDSETTSISMPKDDISQPFASNSVRSGGKNAKVNQLQTAACPPSTSVKSTPKHAPAQKPRLTKLLSGSTPILTKPSLARDNKSSSTSDLSGQHLPRGMGSRRTSIGDLVQPVRSSASSAIESVIQKRRQSVAAVPEVLGILKMKLSAVNTAENTPGPKRSLVDLGFEPGSSSNPVKPVQKPTEGLFCVFTINAGNSRAETSVQPIVPQRPVVWDESEEILFYANQSRQVFILCRKTAFDEAKLNQTIFPASSGFSNVPSVRRMSQGNDDPCIGATVLPVSQVRVSSTSMNVVSADLLQCLQRQQYEKMSLPLQPKGTLLLQTYFYALQPYFRVSCKGTVTLRSLSGLNSRPIHDLSCTVKIDSEFQDSTSVLGSKECARVGWEDEPVEFSAYKNYDCDIQVWAYSSEQTEYWCGGCTVPLAMVLPDKDAKKHKEASRGNNIGVFAVSRPCEKTITVPIEPKGLLTLSFLLYPSPRSIGSQSPDSESPSPEVPDDSISERNFKQGSLRRRNLSTTLRSAGDFGLRIRKSYSEEPFILQQENTDLKREVEYLREELRQTKAKLAESEFYREKALLDLRKSLVK